MSTPAPQPKAESLLGKTLRNSYVIIASVAITFAILTGDTAFVVGISAVHICIGIDRIISILKKEK